MEVFIAILRLVGIVGIVGFVATVFFVLMANVYNILGFVGLWVICNISIAIQGVIIALKKERDEENLKEQYRKTQKMIEDFLNGNLGDGE